MNVKLFRVGLLAWSFELDEQHPAPWKQNHAVGPANIPLNIELERGDGISGALLSERIFYRSL